MAQMLIVGVDDTNGEEELGLVFFLLVKLPHSGLIKTARRYSLITPLVNVLLPL